MLQRHGNCRLLGHRPQVQPAGEEQEPHDVIATQFLYLFINKKKRGSVTHGLHIASISFVL
jgi:hypothetical protein